MPDKSLSNTLNDTAKEYEKLLNTDNGVSQILENADKKAEQNFRSDIKKAEQTAKNIAKKAKAEYSAYSGKTNTQTADSIALNAYQKRLYEVENELQNNIDKSLLAYQALKANGQLSAAELEKENIQNLVQLKKNATDSIIRNANTVYEAKDSERALAYKKERDAIEDKRRQEQINEIINEYMRNPETIDLQKRYMAEKKMYENDASKAWYKVVPVSQADINSLYSEATEEDLEKVNEYLKPGLNRFPNTFPKMNFSEEMKLKKKSTKYDHIVDYFPKLQPVRRPKKFDTTWTDVERAMADGSLERWEKIVIYEYYLRHEERVINTISENIKDDYSGIKDGTIDLAYLASTLGFHNEEEAESLLQAAKIQKLNNEVSEIKSEDEYSPDDLKTKINDVYKGYTEEEKEELFKTYEFKIKSKINFNLKENPEIQGFWDKYKIGYGKKPSEDEQLDVIAQSVMYLSYAAEVIEKITAQQQGNGEWISEGDLTEFYNQVDSSRIQYLDYSSALHIIRLVYEDQLKQSGLSEEERAYIEQQIKYIDNLDKSIEDYYKFMMSAENIYENFGTYEEYKTYINSPEYKLSTLTDEELQNLDTYNTTSGEAPVMSPEERKARELAGLPVPMTEDELKAFISSLGVDDRVKRNELISQEIWKRTTVGEYQKLDDFRNPGKDFVYHFIEVYIIFRETYEKKESFTDNEKEKIASFINRYRDKLENLQIITYLSLPDKDITAEDIDTIFDNKIFFIELSERKILREIYRILPLSTSDVKYKKAENLFSGALYLYDNEKQLELQEDAKNFALSAPVFAETVAALSTIVSPLTDIPGLVKEAFNPRYTEVSGYRPAYAMAAPLTLWRTSVVNGRAETIEDEGWRNAYLIGNSVLQLAAILIPALATGGAAGAAAGGSSAVASSVAKGAALFLMTSNAGTSAYVDASLRGASSDQAFTYGVVVAGINLILEKIPLDDLFNIMNSASKTTMQQGVKGILSKTFRILGHAGLEATEEALTTISETIADDIINGAFSESSQLVQQLVASGYTLEEAKKQAFMSKLADVTVSAIGGGIGGTIFSIGGTVIGSRMSNKAISSDMKMIMGSKLRSLLENFINNKPSTNKEIDMLINSSPELQVAFFNVIQNDLGIDVIFSDTDIIANTDNLLTLFKDPAKYKAQFSSPFKKFNFEGQQKTDVQTGSNPYAQALQINTDTVSNPYRRYMREVDTSAGNAYSRMLPQNGSPDTGTALYTLPEADSSSALSPLYTGEITGNGVTPAGGGIRVSDDNTGVNKNTRAGRNIAYDSPEELLSVVDRELQGTSSTQKINGKSLVYNKVDITPESGSVYEMAAAISNYAKEQGRNVVFYSGDVVYDNNIIEASGFETGDGTLYINISDPDSLYWSFGHEFGHDIIRRANSKDITDLKNSIAELAYDNDIQAFNRDITLKIRENESLWQGLSQSEKTNRAINEILADKFGDYFDKLLQGDNLKKLSEKNPNLLKRLLDGLKKFISYLAGKIKSIKDPLYAKMQRFINNTKKLEKKIQALMKSAKNLSDTENQTSDINFSIKKKTAETITEQDIIDYEKNLDVFEKLENMDKSFYEDLQLFRVEVNNLRQIYNDYLNADVNTKTYAAEQLNKAINSTDSWNSVLTKRINNQNQNSTVSLKNQTNKEIKNIRAKDAEADKRSEQALKRNLNEEINRFKNLEPVEDQLNVINKYKNIAERFIDSNDNSVKTAAEKLNTATSNFIELSKGKQTLKTRRDLSYWYRQSYLAINGKNGLPLKNAAKAQNADMPEFYRSRETKTLTYQEAYANSQELRAEREIVKKETSNILKKLESNDPKKNKYVPIEIIEPVRDFMRSLSDIMNGTVINKESFINHMNKVEKIVSSVISYDSEFDSTIQFSPKLKTDIQIAIDSIENMKTPLSEMTLNQVKNLKNIVKQVNHAIITANEFIESSIKERVSTAAKQSVKELDAGTIAKPLQTIAKHPKSILYSFISTPYFRKFLGNTGEALMTDVMDGYSQFLGKRRSIMEFFDSLNKDIVSKDKTVFERNAREIKFDNSDQKIPLSSGQILSIYLLSKRKHGKIHIMGGGIVVDKKTIESYVKDFKKGKIKNKIKKLDGNAITLTEADIKQIANIVENDKSLKKLADKLVEFLKEVARWGNETTLKQFNTRLFVADDYTFPIEVSRNFLKTNFDENMNGMLRAIENISAVKKTRQGAKNPVIIRDAFEVVYDHATQIAGYYGMSIPISNLMKWYNSAIPGSRTSIKTTIENTLGQGANNFIIQQIKALNNETLSIDPTEGFYMKRLRNVKSASVGWNLRVALQQGTSLPRAGVYLSLPKLTEVYGELIINQKLKHQILKEAIENNGYIYWKASGYFTTDVSRPFREKVLDNITKNNIIKKGSNVIKDNIAFLAEKSDMHTMATIWYVAKNTIKADNPKLAVGSAEFMKKVNELVNKTILETQVIDTPISRVQLMRSNSLAARTLTAFKSENYTQFQSIIINPMIKNIPVKTKFKSIYTGLIGIIAWAVVIAILNHAYYDDEDKTFIEQFKDEFIENFVFGLLSNILGFLPGSDIVFNTMQGFTSGDIQDKWIESIIKAVKKFDQLIKGDLDLSSNEKLYENLFLPVADAFSIWTGYPVKNILRDYNVIVKLFTDFDVVSSSVYESEIYNALISEDKENIDDIKTKLFDIYKKEGIPEKEWENTFNKSMIKYLKTNEKIAEAYKLRKEDKYGEAAVIMAEFVKMGFDIESVEKAVNSFDTAYNKKINEAADYIVAGNTEEANKIKYELLEQGYSEKQITYDINEKVSELNNEEEDKYKFAKSNSTGVPANIIYEAAAWIKDVESTEEYPRKQQIRDFVLDKTDLSDEQRQALFEDMYTSSNPGDLKAYSQAKKELKKAKYKNLTAEEKEDVANDVSLYVSSKNKDEKIEYAEAAGIPPVEYIGIRKIISKETSDKDSNGNAISGSLKKKVLTIINETGWNKNKKLFFLLYATNYQDGFSGYDKYATAQAAKDYIDSLGLSSSKKKKLYEECGIIQ